MSVGSGAQKNLSLLTVYKLGVMKLNYTFAVTQTVNLNHKQLRLLLQEDYSCTVFSRVLHVQFLLFDFFIISERTEGFLLAWSSFIEKSSVYFCMSLSNDSLPISFFSVDCISFSNSLWSFFYHLSISTLELNPCDVIPTGTDHWISACIADRFAVLVCIIFCPFFLWLILCTLQLW